MPTLLGRRRVREAPEVLLEDVRSGNGLAVGVEFRTELVAWGTW